MSIMEAMMESMMNRMSKEDKSDMMDKMMARFFEGMSKEEKQKMMEDVMPKMMEGMTMMDMMSGMMGSEQGGMMGMMSGMKCGDSPEGIMPPMAHMMENMMPHCLEMILPQMPKEARGDFAIKLIKSLLDNGANGMTEDEKKEYRKRIFEAIQTTSTPA